MTPTRQLIILFFTALPFIANAGDLSSLRACLSNRYQGLSNRNAIAVATLDINSEEFMNFGNATEGQFFEIGSITKTFTAQLLALDVVNQRIKLSDSIPATYQKPGTTITYQHLTSHTSGIMAGIFPDFKITNDFFPFDGLTVSIFKSLYAKTPLESIPGATWSYSNIGSALLGLILSEESGVPYETRVRNEILKPLGMNETYFQVPSEKLNRFPNGYMAAADGTRKPMPHWDLYTTAIDPAGGIRSTIQDMVLYARAHLRPESTPLQKAVILAHNALYSIKGPNLQIGMNWILQPDKGLIWHNGQTYGFNSILAISTTRQQAVVALTDTTVMKKTANGEETFDTSLQDIIFECLQ
jgi:serine-type D-Ala-D-Ala carboxypeptidase/endopeptidase